MLNNFNKLVIWTLYKRLFQKQVLALHFNSSPPGQNSRHFEDDIFKHIFLNEMFCILIQISLKFVPKGPNDKKSVLV